MQRVFLADGDALVMRTEFLLGLLHYVKKNFPYAERAASYGMAKDVLRKSEEELIALRKAGPAMIYFGAESGGDEVFVHIQKGETTEEIIVVGQKLKRYGIQASVTLTSGLGGSTDMGTRAVRSAKLINAMNPGYASILILHLPPESPMTKEIQRGEMELLKPDRIVNGTKFFLAHIDLPETVFRTNHASNYLAFAGTFNQDLPRLLHKMREVYEHNHYRMESRHRGF